MKRINVGANFAVFVLFFGLATLEALQNQNWFRSLLWLAFAIVFLAADNMPRREDRQGTNRPW